jgi:hypothetical protein
LVLEELHSWAARFPGGGLMLSPTKYARGYLVARLKINGADEKYSAETLVAGLQFVQESINGDGTKKW